MPNLVGIWRPPEQPGAETLLGSQTSAVQCGHVPYRTYSMRGRNWVAALVDHGLLENGDQPGASSSGRWRLLLDGEVLNLDEVLRQAGLDNLIGLADSATKCAALFDHAESAIVGKFSGSFAIVAWDARENQLLLISDRLASRPLFYRNRGNSVAFGTELKAIVAAQPERNSVDAVAVCERLTYGVHFSGRTWLDGCERLPPATILRLSESSIELRRYWLYGYNYRAGRPRVIDSAFNYATLLDRAVERNMRGSRRIGIFLSGGYDSRSVAASLRKERLPIPAFTFGEAASRDMQIAPRLAARIGLTHEVLNAGHPALAQYAEAIVWRTDGLVPFANATSMQFHDELCRKVEIFLTGFLGEFSGSHTWPRLLLARNRKAAIRAIKHRFVLDRLVNARAVMRAHMFDDARLELERRFEASFESVENEHPMDIADSWNFLHLQPNGSFQTPAVDRHRLEMRSPHTDRDLVDFLLTLPPSVRIEQRVYKTMIAHAYPRIRDIPCANSMRPINPNFWLEYPRMAMDLAMRKLSAPIGRVFGHEDRLGRELSDLDADLRTDHAVRDRLLGPLIDGGYLDDQVFDLNAIRRITAEHYCGKANHGELVVQLVTLGLAAKQLVSGEVRDIPEIYRTSNAYT